MIYALAVLAGILIIALLPSHRPRSRHGRSAAEIRADMKHRGKDDKKVRML